MCRTGDGETAQGGDILDLQALFSQPLGVRGHYCVFLLYILRLEISITPLNFFFFNGVIGVRCSRLVSYRRLGNSIMRATFWTFRPYFHDFLGCAVSIACIYCVDWGNSFRLSR